MCGAAYASTVTDPYQPGLSPRVRGSQLVSSSADISRRSIPTCAGQPPASPLVPRQRRVYPHVCGAARSPADYMNAFDGLSPRVRGSLRSALRGNRPDGSIPTCAGQPLTVGRIAVKSTVYPHVCGAARVSPGCDNCYMGLSPRVRGSLSRRIGNHWRYRSIPTCAGQPVTAFR